MTYRHAFTNHRYLLGVCFAYMIVVVGVCLIMNVDIGRFAATVGFFALIPLFYIPVLMGACFLGAVVSCFKDKSLMAISRRTEEIWNAYIHSERALNGFAGLLAISPLLIFFCIFKSLFPVLAPVQMDAAFANLDLLIHGAYPYEYLMPFIARFHLGYGLELVYVVWFLFMFVANFYCLFFDRDDKRRKQYLWTFALNWILGGTVLALLLYSAGPIFYHLVLPDVSNPYEVFKTAGPNTYNGAMMLYGMAADTLRPDINGPSAMPSMHVSMAWLFALYAFRIKPALGWFMTLYAFAMLVASVGLGWHYAVDGYVGIILATVIWFTVGRFNNMGNRNVE